MYNEHPCACLLEHMYEVFSRMNCWAIGWCVCSTLLPAAKLSSEVVSVYIPVSSLWVILVHTWNCQVGIVKFLNFCQSDEWEICLFSFFHKDFNFNLCEIKLTIFVVQLFWQLCRAVQLPKSRYRTVPPPEIPLSYSFVVNCFPHPITLVANGCCLSL